jgi:hypothetical protein
MVRRGILGTALLIGGFGIGAIAGACSGGGDASGKPTDILHGDGGVIFWGDASANTGITINPPKLDLTVNPGGPALDPVQFELEGDTQGEDVHWRITNPGLGFIDSSGLFHPNGTVGGEGDIEAIVGSAGFRAHVTITVNHVQNGGTTVTTDPGAGGLGGVGGEGEGGAVPEDLLDVLKGKPVADARLSLLYPYDKTVFPLGILPPLLQWSTGGHGSFEGVYVHLSSPPHYDYKGYFGRPALLAGGADFVRHPIPKDVWTSATKSAAGRALTLELVVAAGGKAYGPITQTWKIALAPFSGKVFYQAYATAFVKNEVPEMTTWGDRFGGATLSIKVGDESPELVAGADSTEDKAGCRVCHSVSAYGDRMIAQHGDEYTATSSYDLKNGNTQASPYTDGTVGWAGLYPDGTLGLANSIDVTGSNSNDGDTALYDMATGRRIASPGLAPFARKIALPAFSPDGKKAAFTLFEGESTPAIGAADRNPLVSMDFDLATKRFSNPTLLWRATENGQRPTFVTFFPASDAVVFQRRWPGTNDDQLSTWYESRGELWWVDLATQSAQPLANLNGAGYLPEGPNGHDDDARLNYEPSISPVASGGYAWIVFMSRRMYGNVATSGPWHADPRDWDTHTPCTAERTDDCYATKKLWMAALDLNAAPGTDPSHPAFYIPGQEIKGTNSRPFFALAPCVSDRGTCSTGIDCCSGFCTDGYCSPPPVNECSELGEKCVEASDCCDPHATCYGGYCTIILR